MAFRPANIPASTDPPPSEWRINALNGGAVYTDLPQRILNNQSPKMLNMWYKERALTKRYGQEYVFDSLGAFPILSNYDKLYKGKVIFTASTKMYSLDLDTGIATEIHTGLTAVKGSFFVFKNSAGADILYYKCKGDYIQYDGTIAKATVEVDGATFTADIYGVKYNDYDISFADNTTEGVDINHTAKTIVVTLDFSNTPNMDAATWTVLSTTGAGGTFAFTGTFTGNVSSTGTTASGDGPEDVTGYIPLVVTGRESTGGGTVYEDYNRIQAGFKNSFSPNGADTIFTLTQTDLDATTVTSTTGEEGTDFTVDRTAGTVTFTSAPASGTDSLVITAYKTDADAKTLFMDLKFTATFGGDNDSRVFFAGDSTTYYYSGVSDPTYIPENNYNNAGVDNTYLTGFGKQYGILVAFKERSIYSISYEFDGTNVRFPLKQINNTIGCDMPYTIQLINDALVWCNTYAGVHTLLSTDIKDERNVRPLSENINGTLQNPGLLAETDLANATSVDYFGHYWICVGNKAWVWNYEITPFVYSGNPLADQQRLAWFPFSGINANCFFGVDQELYYGDRTVGRYIHFINNYKDFDGAIEAYWRSKLLDFDLFDWTKVILEQRFGTKSDTYTKVKTLYIWDDGERYDPTEDIVSTFSWANFHWDLFSWRVIRFARTITKRPKIKNTIYYQTEISNNIAGHNLSVLDLAILFMNYRKVK